MPHLKAVFLSSAATLLLICNAGSSQVFTPLNDPLATGGTYAGGISGQNITGGYSAGGTVHGFLYNGNTYTTLDDPSAGSGGTHLEQIAGNNIVGYYADSSQITHGLIYNISSGIWTTLDDPLGNSSEAIGVSATGDVVGSYTSTAVPHTGHGFIYSNDTFTTIDDPAANGSLLGTQAFGIYGNSIVGSYYNSSDASFGFVYSGGNFTPINDAVSGASNTTAHGISGAIIVGSYQAGGITNGYFYNGTSFTTLDDPLATTSTMPLSADGSNIVGGYTDATGTHGFVTSVPEPISASYLAFGTLILLRRRTRDRKYSTSVLTQS
jgi:hypothetical protein